MKEQNTSLSSSSKLGKKLLFVILGLVILFVIVLFGFFASGVKQGYNSAQNKAKEAEEKFGQWIVKSVDPIEALVDSSEWKTYTNSVLGFSLKHPENFFIKEEKNGSITTVTFSNKEINDTEPSGQEVRDSLSKNADFSKLAVSKIYPNDPQDLEKDVKSMFSGGGELQKTTINGVDSLIYPNEEGAVAGTGKGVITYVYLRAKDTYVYDSTMFIGSDDKDSEKIIKTILSTFSIL